jgi:hypothetical protein
MSTSTTVRRWGMKDLLASDLELVCRSGFLYLPLLFDPSVAREIEGNVDNHVVADVGGRRFVRTVSLRSLVGNYEALYPKSYEELRRSNLKRFSGELTRTAAGVSERLKTILFSVMPHFLGRRKSLDRKSLTEGQVLDLIGKRIEIPGGSCEPAGNRLDPGFFRRLLADLEEHRPAVEPPPEGVMPARAFGDWLSKALEASFLEEERLRLTRILDAQEPPGAEARYRMRTLLHVAERGALEVDGFGFRRIGAGDDYLIYKHTGEYALRDYYGRLYLFPDCRVAVFTGATLKPFVVETYKHPFLEGRDSGQAICLRNRTPAMGFSATAVVDALEEGINALLYGYSSRRRNGYHSLEGFPKRTGSPGLGDSSVAGPTDAPVRRMRHILDVDFEDYRIPDDHAKVTSGQVEITNNYLP